METKPYEPSVNDYVFGLDVVRASAVTLVVASHLTKPLEPLGVFGVELFFVLSGYLVGGIFVNRASIDKYNLRDLLTFWQRRWARTLPNYYFFVLVWVALSHFLGASQPAGLWRYTVFLQGAFWPVAGFFVVSWSLAIEEWFYVIFPLLSSLLIWTDMRPVRAVVTVTTGVIIFSFILRLLVGHTPDINLDMRMVTSCRLDAIVFGVCGLLTRLYRPRVWLWFKAQWIFGALVAISLSQIIVFGVSNIFVASMIFTLLPIACLSILAKASELPEFKRYPNLWKNISHWSYSLYLVHMPVLLVFQQLPIYTDHGALMKLLDKIIAIAMAISLSALLFRFFERPALWAFSPRLREPRRACTS